ncbi:GCN5 family acetyltransferase [Patiriisocius marinistellae]|uniref:GCN5 family acetyltransferase n=1 Tax=Patiriisocius marinistellae TaxID=2494560 RepID=A0A5J4FYM4_9FLAO|nr:GNAT family protein [Patiriisocius marinistellae]GEQ87370.1 GCN5 family acetyltransferase [Patiriisocius marinistellae]
MITSETVQLENARVLLRPLVAKDASALLGFVKEESEIWTYSLRQLQTTSDLNDYISEALRLKKLGSTYAFTVFDKLKKQYAGCTRFYNIDDVHKTLMLGYTWYGKEFQGTGLNKNVKLLLLEYAFEILQMERVEFRADVNNLRSIRAMKSIGCKEEGVLRQNFAIANKRRDSIILSIIKTEWAECKQLLLKSIYNGTNN